MDPGKTSRCFLHSPLLPSQWVVCFQKEDWVGDPAFQYSRVTFHVGNDITSQGDAYIAIQESAAGVAGTWVNRWFDKVPVHPGAFRFIDWFHVQPFVRVIAFGQPVLNYPTTGVQGNGTGKLSFTITDPEDQVLPNFEYGYTMSCSTWCEIDCESNAETVDF